MVDCNEALQSWLWQWPFHTCVDFDLKHRQSIHSLLIRTGTRVAACVAEFERNRVPNLRVQCELHGDGAIYLVSFIKYRQIKALVLLFRVNLTYLAKIVSIRPKFGKHLVPTWGQRAALGLMAGLALGGIGNSWG